MVPQAVLLLHNAVHMQASKEPWPGQVDHMVDYVAGQLAPSVALAALRQGGVTITRKELLEKVCDGGIARRSAEEKKQVEKYENARKIGKATILSAIKAASLQKDDPDVLLLTQQWKSVAETLLVGVTYNDIFAAEAEIIELAKKMMDALVRVRRIGRTRPATEMQQ